MRVNKVKSIHKIQLEFFSKEDDGSYSLINTVDLKGSREAYFNYGIRGKTRPPSSLGFYDVNGDGTFDILAPTFNKFFHPYLNVVFYNSKTKKFELKNKVPHPQNST